MYANGYFILKNYPVSIANLSESDKKQIRLCYTDALHDSKYGCESDKKIASHRLATLSCLFGGVLFAEIDDKEYPCKYRVRNGEFYQCKLIKKGIPDCIHFGYPSIECPLKAKSDYEP